MGQLQLSGANVEEHEDTVALPGKSIISEDGAGGWGSHQFPNLYITLCCLENCGRETQSLVFSWFRAFPQFISYVTPTLTCTFSS